MAVEKKKSSFKISQKKFILKLKFVCFKNWRPIIKQGSSFQGFRFC